MTRAWWVGVGLLIPVVTGCGAPPHVAVEYVAHGDCLGKGERVHVAWNDVGSLPDLDRLIEENCGSQVRVVIERKP